jgi:hypothetical protein
MNKWRNIKKKQLAVVEICPILKVLFIGSGTATPESN